MVESGLERSATARVLAIAGHGDQQRLVPGPCADASRQFIAVDQWQADVEQADVRRFIEGTVHCAQRIGLRERIVPGDAEA